MSVATRSTGQRRKTVPAAMLVAGAAIGLVGTAAPAQAAVVSRTFSYTGAEQTFVVPTGVTRLTVTAIGAPGGGVRRSATFIDDNGGRGRIVTADIPVTPGQTLYVEVGGPGETGQLQIVPFFSAGPGGFNGGGDGGFSYNVPLPGGGGGGGASDVRSCSASAFCLPGSLSPESRLVVASGGGGGAGASGGDGDMDGGSYIFSHGSAGEKGTTTAGGAGGDALPGYTGQDPETLQRMGQSGEDGTLATGGRGGDSTHYPNSGGGGGGGGGGYFGGGGGAGGSALVFPSDAGGGGGGSFVSPAAANVSFGVDLTGQPSVTISYEVGSPTITTQASSGGPVGTAVRDVATLAGGTSPTGTVTFRLFSDAGCDNQLFTSTNNLTGLTARSGWFTPATAGTYRWTAVYSGDANNAPVTSPCNASNESVVVTPFVAPAYSRTVSGDVAGPVTVNAGESVLISSGARVVGPVTVNPGGALTVGGARITRSVVVDNPRFLSICGTDISGPSPGVALRVINASVPIRIGDPAAGCAGNRFAGQVDLTMNMAVTFGGNTVSHDATVDNGGPGQTIIKGNRIFGTLACSGNSPAPGNAGEPNSAGSKTGQCTTL